MPVDSQYYQAEQAADDARTENDPPYGETQKMEWALERLRKEQGQWKKGVSGNPAGRPLGSRNRATIWAQQLVDASSALVVSKIIARAIDGNELHQRFIGARILPPRRSAPVELDLPPLDTQKDISLAIAAVANAVAAGEITPAEAGELGRMLETAMRAIERREHEYSANYPYGTRPPAAPPEPAKTETFDRPAEAAIEPRFSIAANRAAR